MAIRSDTQSSLPRTSSPPASMIDQIAGAIAKAEGARFETDRARLRGLALAGLRRSCRTRQPI